ncbi:helix-turn-helix domain-containing protein (plasmid) [Streptomyces sp. NBC_00015]|uniref:helix-turn-helix domain-containing protein n=1 Tax=Streptomyces sp. NBC_00015 TaxID=2903611 RepID=UPI002F9195D7
MACACGQHGTSPRSRREARELIRQTRQAKGQTLAHLGKQTGYSAAQVSRYKRGISPMTDVDVLRCFADALELPHQAFGLAPPASRPEVRHGQPIGATSAFPRLPTSRVGRSGMEDGEEPVRRRKLLGAWRPRPPQRPAPRSLGAKPRRPTRFRSASCWSPS